MQVAVGPQSCPRLLCGRLLPPMHHSSVLRLVMGAQHSLLLPWRLLRPVVQQHLALRAASGGQLSPCRQAPSPRQALHNAEWINILTALNPYIKYHASKSTNFSVSCRSVE